MRTIDYVDGFNLYYDSLKGTSYHLSALSVRLLPRDKVTAAAVASPQDVSIPRTDIGVRGNGVYVACTPGGRTAAPARAREGV